MLLIINGEDRDVAENTTLLELLTTLAMNPKTVVVERNGEVIPRETYADVRLQEGDQLELVRLVGGG